MVTPFKSLKDIRQGIEQRLHTEQTGEESPQLNVPKPPNRNDNTAKEMTQKMLGQTQQQNSGPVNEPQSIQPLGQVPDFHSQGIQKIQGLESFNRPTEPAVPQETANPLPSNGPSPEGQYNPALKIGEQYLGTPYQWGGTTPNEGFDCSGLVQHVYKQMGIDLPRVSADQAKAGQDVGSMQQARPGDLVFWKGKNGRPNHIGIYAGNGQMLESPRTGLNVRYSDMSNRATPDAIRRVS